MIAALAEAAFKACMGGDYAHAAAGVTIMEQTQLPVELFAILPVAEAFAVRGIDQKERGFHFQRQIPQILLHHGDFAANARLL